VCPLNIRTAPALRRRLPDFPMRFDLPFRRGTGPWNRPASLRHSSDFRGRPDTKSGAGSEIVDAPGRSIDNLSRAT